MTDYSRAPAPQLWVSMQPFNAYNGQSGTERARQTFRARMAERQPPGKSRDFIPSVLAPVRGLGDEAFLERAGADYWFLPPRTSVALLVRTRNVLFGISFGAGLSPASGTAVDSFNAREAVLLPVAREILARLGAPAQHRSVTRLTYQPEEIRTPQPACTASKKAGTLVPNAKVLKLARKDDPSRSACDWSNVWGGDDDFVSRDLFIEVEAIGPSPVTGETGTAIASALYPAWASTSESHRTNGLSPLPGLGDGAHILVPESNDDTHELRIIARHRNLLVGLTYSDTNVSESHRPPGQMKAEARQILTEILKANH